MKPEDIRDALLRHLLPPPAGAAARAPAAAPPPAPNPPAPARSQGRRTFLTDRDVRKALTPGSRDLTITKDAIVSPLALEWLALNGVRIVRRP